VPVAVASFVMLGGMANAVMLPGQPTAFIVIDLAGYLPMGWLGWQLAMHLRPVGR
jgi:threonine/homoserine/homoserine lactone efflux protein